jgi:hypothetical protein
MPAYLDGSEMGPGLDGSGQGDPGVRLGVGRVGG